MAPVKKPQHSAHKGRKSTTTSSTAGSAASKLKSKSKSKDAVKRPPPKQVKTKRANAASLITKSRKPKQRVYTDSQLKLPAVNGIVPASAAAKTGRGAGKKKDKVYVDDTESMMTILALVNAEKEGQIESKVLKARRLEEIREARRVEAEKRAEGKKGRLEEVKMGLKKRKGRNGEKEKRVVDVNEKEGGEEEEEGGSNKRKKRKSVSFAS